MEQVHDEPEATLSADDVEAALRLFAYLLAHPAQRDTPALSKLRYLAKQWLTPGHAPPPPPPPPRPALR